MKPFTLVCVVTLFTAGLACAQQETTAPGGQDSTALEQKVRDLEDRLVALEGQVRVLKAQAEAGQAPAAAPAATSIETASQPPAAAESVAVASTPVSLGGAGGSAAKAMNPDISMIGDFVAFAGAIRSGHRRRSKCTSLNWECRRSLTLTPAGISS